MTSIRTLLKAYFDGEVTQVEYWDKVSSAREVYYKSSYGSISGEEEKIELFETKALIDLIKRRLSESVNDLMNMNDGIPPTYFTYEALDFEIVSNEPEEEVKVNAVKRNALPVFLETPMKMLKHLSEEKGRELYTSIKESDLYDTKLKMYKTSVPLDEMPYDIGRIRAFTPGWLERESNFLHMSYKYLLETLKNGLYEEFLSDSETMLVCNMEPEVYGRSILENSSFIATSRNPDPQNHGRGFVSRLSGSTAEVISMWKNIILGPELFKLDEELIFELSPSIPSSWFREDGTIEFKTF